MDLKLESDTVTETTATQQYQIINNKRLHSQAEGGQHTIWDQRKADIQ